MTTEDDDLAEALILARLRSFREQGHSLRISASSIAAMTGFHPYKCLPELLLSLVYQGTNGQELYQHDCKLLQLLPKTQEEILLDLAKKASKSTSMALLSALDVKKGIVKMETIQEAQTIKKLVLKEAQQSKKLTPAELRLLQDGVRDSVNTGYGHAHEEEALNLYEKQCGWQVKERNEEIMAWPFIKAEDASESSNPSSAKHVATVVPLRQASPVYKMLSSEGAYREKTDNCEHEKERELKRSKLNKQDPDGEVDQTEKDQVGTERNEGRIQDDPLPLIGIAQEKSSSPRPFFSIRGAVDGIREELWCPPPALVVDQTATSQSSPGNDEAWALRQIIVECKHRMNKAIQPPPLYDQIQTAAYCLMYNVDQADIVQVMRERCAEEEANVTKDDGKPQPTPSTPDRSKNGKLVVKPNQKSTPDGSTSEKTEAASKGSPDSSGKTRSPGQITDYLSTRTPTTESDSQDDGNTMTNTVNEEEGEEDKRCTVGAEPEQEPSTLDCRGQKGESSTTENVAQGDEVQLTKVVSEDEPQQQCTEATKDGMDKHLTSHAQPQDPLQEKGATKNQPEEKKNVAKKVAIVVTRVSLDEPVMQHRRNWNDIILPRLRSFVEAVYAVRKSDEKRYQLLRGMAESDIKGNEDDAWEVLHKECPWLLDCDTAFYRQNDDKRIIQEKIT